MSKLVRFTPLFAFIVVFTCMLAIFPLAPSAEGAPALLPKKKRSAKATAAAAAEATRPATLAAPRIPHKVAPSPSPTPVPAPDDDSSDEGPEPETAPRRVGIDSASAIRLNYGRNTWNRSSTQVDAAAIFLKEGATGRIVQIEVEETAPDSAVFSGIYSINWHNLEQNLDKLRVEFYAPPQELLLNLAGRRKITAMIEKKELRRLPFVLRRDASTGVQHIELFDSPDQARFAYKAFQAEQQLLIALQNRLANRDQTLDTARLASEKQELEEASRNLAERVRLGQLEAQKLAQLLQGFANASPEERARRKTEAEKIADQALLDYRAGRFNEARDSFEKAVALDPTNRGYYFQFGVTLYKLEDFNRSLVYLELAEGKTVNPVERDFYKGLNFYRLKDSTSALATFESVANAKDPGISPSAVFYRGLIFYERKKWEEARGEFQKVLDSSSDPALDAQAESYIEQILRQQQFEAARAQKWSLGATIGFMADDNVTTSSDSDRDRGTATNTGAWRTLFQGNARYRPLYEETREFAAQLDLLTMYSVSNSFQVEQSIRNSDPTVIGLTLPWTHKGMILSKGHKMDVIPGYETTYMSIDNNEWKAIFASYTLGFQNLLIMRETWFTNINLDIRQDNSNVSTSTGDNDATALKTKLGWSNINMVSDDKKQLVVSEVAYTLNNSLGKNSVFNRLDLSAGYIRPWKWDTTFNSKLGYFLLNYTENSNGRIDNSYSLTTGLSRKVWDEVTGGLTATYNINNSNVDANQSKKFTVLLSFSTNKMF